MSDKDQCQVIYSTHSPIFADVNRFEALRLVRRESGQHSRVTFVSEENQKSLKQARNVFKLGGKFDTARNEVLFANGALLLEGYGDRIAALLVAEKLKFDLDAESVAIVDCGGKAGIELVVRVCRSLEIPFVVLHDEDIWPIEDIADEEKRKKQEKENKDEQEKNRNLKEAIGNGGALFVLKPSLEVLLGISREARDKPRRIAEALEKIEVDKVPADLGPLIRAVRAAMQDAQK